MILQRNDFMVATDIQGNLRDFQRMLALCEQSPEDSVLVFTGDLVHGPDEVTERQWPDYLGPPLPRRVPRGGGDLPRGSSRRGRRRQEWRLRPGTEEEAHQWLRRFGFSTASPAK
ncbi:metallophosphoesterase [Hyalangium sp.]|uniref:metallophosphoesterase n=1 Tax=Hyalangium sp. TaxID=2028555 RepID=UPI002D5B0AC3|nr:metallophosphoesterase [Hyalangium sp.]HYH96538.1 metallophosphoesterase [Hyalangium sp.]